MNNINQAGTENAASMVQAEKAAKGLNELGQKLKLLVEQYKNIKAVSLMNTKEEEFFKTTSSNISG